MSACKGVLMCSVGGCVTAGVVTAANVQLAKTKTHPDTMRKSVEYFLRE